MHETTTVVSVLDVVPDVARRRRRPRFDEKQAFFVKNFFFSAQKGLFSRRFWEK